MTEAEKKLKRGAAYEGGLSGAQSAMVAGATLGGTIGSAVPVLGTAVGAAIGAGVGLVGGGLVGGLRANKQYKDMLKMQKEQDKLTNKQKKDAEAYARREMFDVYGDTIPPTEMDLSVSSPTLSSYDAFKMRKFGGV
jgi:phage tail tape-measure protein